MVLTPDKSGATVSTDQNSPVDTSSNNQDNVRCDRCDCGFTSSAVRRIHVRDACIGKCEWCEKEGLPCNAGSTVGKACTNCQNRGRQCNGAALQKQQRGQRKESS